MFAGTNMNKIKDSYDAIVVGAGIGGLTAANYLAKAGKSVLLIETEKHVGGCCTSFKKGEYTFDAAAHIFAACGKMEPVWSILQEIEVDLLFEKIPELILNFPELQLTVSQDIDYLRDDLKRYFPAQSEKIDQFFKDILQIYYKFTNNPDPNDTQLNQVLNLSYAAFLDRYFKRQLLKDTLSFLWLFTGDRPGDISALAMINLIGSFLRHGTYRVVGGAQVLSDTLAEELRKKGGSVLLSNRVIRIRTDNNKVVGVTLANNKEINAGTIVSNIDPRTTYLELLQSKELASQIANLKIGIVPFELYLGVNFPEAEDFEGAYFSENNINNILGIIVPTKYDTSLAPPDRHIIQATTSFPKKFEEVDDWGKIKTELENSTLNLIEQYMPGIKSAVKVKDSATPKTTKRFTGNFNGSAYGWASTPDQFWKNRLGFKTEIEGLFLCGHWTTFGGGIHSVIRSGKECAHLILK